LADFIVEWTGPLDSHQQHTKTIWTIHCDGAWCHAGAGIAAIITSTIGIKYKYTVLVSFTLESDKCTNNITEYEAITLGLRKFRALGVETCIVKTDSKIIAGQIEKYFSAKEPVLMQYFYQPYEAWKNSSRWFTLLHIEWNKNRVADTLAKAAAKGDPLPLDVSFHFIGT
jgi:ribonuclease HI